MAIPGYVPVLATRNKIRVGVKKRAASGKEFPSAVDWFVSDDPEFRALYADKPKELVVWFPYENATECFDTGLEWWAGSSLVCYTRGVGDPVRAYRVADKVDPQDEVLGFADGGLDGGNGRTGIVCRNNACAHRMSGKECGPVGRLRFWLDGGLRGAVLQFDTRSMITIRGLGNFLRSAALRDDLRGRPFLLSVQFVKNQKGRFPVVSLSEFDGVAIGLGGCGDAQEAEGEGGGGGGRQGQGDGGDEGGAEGVRGGYGREGASRGGRGEERRSGAAEGCDGRAGQDEGADRVRGERVLGQESGRAPGGAEGERNVDDPVLPEQSAGADDHRIDNGSDPVSGPGVRGEGQGGGGDSGGASGEEGQEREVTGENSEEVGVEAGGQPGGRVVGTQLGVGGQGGLAGLAGRVLPGEGTGLYGGEGEGEEGADAGGRNEVGEGAAHKDGEVLQENGRLAADALRAALVARGANPDADAVREWVERVGGAAAALADLETRRPL